MNRLSLFLLLIFSFASSFALSSDDKKKDDPWVPVEEKVKIWDDVVAKELGLPLPLPNPKPYTVSENGLEATFEKDGAKWTIIGANAPIVNPTVYPKDWPVKGNGFDILVIPEPITNYKILPFTEKIENAVKSDTISITAAKDSYEPASFVIRSGDVDLKDVMVEASDLKARVKDKNGRIRTVVFPKENIDVRLVKCWYQAGVAINDTKHKLLTPELLLHDDDVVDVDYKSQVNMVRDLEKVEDSKRPEKFGIQKNQNKQVWLTVHVSEKTETGQYSGHITVKSGEKAKKLHMHINVLFFVLPEPLLDYALYYEGYLSGQSNPVIGWRPKTETQMLYELIDMKEHGLTNATVWHEVSADKNKWDDDWKRLRRTLELRRKIGWSAKPLLYLDWKTRFSDDLQIYKEKVENIVRIAGFFGIGEVYVYGKDEKKGPELLALRKLYSAVHDAGAKNFVACTEDFLISVPDLLDLPIIYNRPRGYFMKLIEKLGIRAWNYGNPQTGLEEPETYRENYGVKLFLNGFSGVCNYVYQHGTSWNDFSERGYRLHMMTYPTTTKPIPTIQWEGWREGVNDMRYLTLMMSKKKLTTNWVDDQCQRTATDCRKKAIRYLSDILAK